MSHFTMLRTRMMDDATIRRALSDLGFEVVDGPVKVAGYRDEKAEADFKAVRWGREIGFRRGDDGWEMIADWWMVEKAIRQDKFVQTLMQRYAYLMVVDRLVAQSFSLATEEHDKDGTIRLVFRSPG